jgi:hypothetical protein
MNILEEIENLAIKVAQANSKGSLDRDTDIVMKRFCLKGEELCTLEDIGDYYGISGARVGQVEATVIKNLKKILNGDVLPKGVSASDALILEFERVKLEVYGQDYILVEKDVQIRFSEIYSLNESSNLSKLIPLLLQLLGYFKLPSNISGYSGEILPCWCLSESFDRKSINNIFKILKKYRAKVDQIKIFDLVVKSKRDHGERINKELLHLILKTCPDFKKVDENSIEVRFESLTSIADKAYRVLVGFNEPKHFNDILREINFRISKSGIDKIAIGANLKNQMGLDDRFVAIAKSGYWVLKSWDSVSSKSITELMELHLHMENNPRSVEQLYDYVSSKRPGVSKQSITTYLADKPQFDRTGEKEYSLVSWGLDSVVKVQNSNTITKIREAVEEIFSTTETISNSMLIQKVVDITGVSTGAIRKAIKACKEIEVISSSGKTNILKCNDLRLNSLSTQKPKKLIREKIQEEIITIMMARSGAKIQKLELYKEVKKNGPCIRPTFYSYLSEMTNIQQYGSSNKYYCEMKLKDSPSSAIPYLDLSPLDSCDNPEIIENVIKATDKLNEKDVDIGLFELGRTFENVLKQFLLLSKVNDSFEVNRKDLEKLVAMINCVEKNKEFISVKFKQHHLTLLREDRNLRAHGVMPSKQDKLVILTKAPFIVEMYIDYIVRFSALVSKPFDG